MTDENVINNAKNLLALNNDKKLCLYCNAQIFKQHKTKKYCNDNCRVLNIKKNTPLKGLNMEREHDRKLEEANKKIMGEIVHNSRSKYGANPDIIKGDTIFEVELFGHSTVRTKTRWYKDSNKKKILIISIRDDLKKLFDRVYILDKDIMSIEHFNQKEESLSV